MFGRRKKPKAASTHPDFPTMSEIGYRHVLSEIQARRNAQRYLEIGSRTGDSIARVKCSFIAVDPEFAIRADVFNKAPQMMFFQQTSDDFFASRVLQKLDWVPDLCFVDGLHKFEYALRDFMNAEKAMTQDGIICLHDVCPYDYDMTVRDPAPEHGLKAWTGDVWKVVAALLDVRPDLKLDVVAARSTGLACITNLDPQNRDLDDNYDALMAKYLSLELSEIGAHEYYDRFELVEPSSYVAAL